jgi:hypothetical protein
VKKMILLVFLMSNVIAIGHEHDDHDEHGEHAEDEYPNVGPDKGILKADEDRGFKLRDGVEARFSISRQTLGKDRLFPKDAILYSKEDIQIFRKRDGYWKAIDVSIVRKGQLVSLASDELRADDEIAVQGAGFLKIMELSVFGPAMQGHIH